MSKAAIEHGGHEGRAHWGGVYDEAFGRKVEATPRQAVQMAETARLPNEASACMDTPGMPPSFGHLVTTGPLLRLVRGLDFEPGDAPVETKTETTIQGLSTSGAMKVPASCSDRGGG